MDYPEGDMGYNLSPLPQHTAIPTEVASPEAGEQKSPKMLMTSRGQVQTNVSSLESLGLPDTTRVHSHVFFAAGFHPEGMGKMVTMSVPRWHRGADGDLLHCSPGPEPSPPPTPSFR